MKTRKLLLLAIPLIAVGCSTSYQPRGFTGGYTDMKIQDDIFQVSFSGNGYTGRQKAQNFALLRSAEVTFENGYHYFVVLGGETMNEQSSFTTPVQSHTIGQVYGYRNSATFRSQTIYTGGQTYNFNKPVATLTIRCFKTKPEDAGGIIYDAETVQTNMRSQYGIN